MDTAVTIAGVAFVVLLVLASLVVPLVTDGPVGERRRRRIMRVTYVGVAVIAVLLVLGGLAVPVFLVAVVADITFGEHENIPFSRYPMFARPAPMSWFIRVEGTDGSPVRPPRQLGLTSSAIRKRYASEITAVAGRPGASMRASDDEQDQAGQRLLVYLRSKGRAGVGPLRVVRVEMTAARDGLDVHERVVAREP